MHSYISLENKKILVVDDNPKNLQLIGNVLDKLSLDLRFAFNAKDALASVDENTPDLILLDINMPEMDGFEVCTKIKDNPIYENIPVIFITAYNKDQNSINKGFEVGGVDYIVKPFNNEELIARVTTHLRLKAYQDYLEKLSYTDPLTGLYNRRMISNQIEEEIKRHQRNPQPFSLIITDIDHFKQFNDNYGHEAGDEVLIHIAGIFRQKTRSQDCLSRWGGEEFLFFLPDTSEQGAVVTAEKLRKTVENYRINYEENDLQVTMTFGITEYQKGLTTEQCIKNADLALYTGKNNGRNQSIAFSQLQNEK